MGNSPTPASFGAASEDDHEREQLRTRTLQDNGSSHSARSWLTMWHGQNVSVGVKSAATGFQLMLECRAGISS